MSVLKENLIISDEYGEHIESLFQQAITLNLEQFDCHLSEKFSQGKTQHVTHVNDEEDCNASNYGPPKQVLVFWGLHQVCKEKQMVG